MYRKGEALATSGLHATGFETLLLTVLVAASTETVPNFVLFGVAGPDEDVCFRALSAAGKESPVGTSFRFVLDTTRLFDGQENELAYLKFGSEVVGLKTSRSE